MKIVVKILALMLILMIFASNIVMAADYPCKISLSSSKTTFKPGDEITISISIADITLSEGINNITAIIDYPEEIFDVIFDESEEAEEQVAIYSESLGTEGDVAMFYIGQNDTTSTNSNWNGLLYIDSTGKKGIMLTASERQTTSKTIAKLKFKVKDSAPKTSAKVSLDSIVAYDANTNEKEVNNTSITFSIDGVETIVSKPANNVQNNLGSSGNLNNNVNNAQNVNQQEDISEKDAPNTGIEDYVPAFSIIIIIAVFSYINYRRYKDI